MTNPDDRSVYVLILSVFTSLLFFTQVASAAAGPDRNAFSKKTFAGAMRAIGASNASADKRIRINAPTMAEIGNMVPIEVDSGIPGTESISVLVEKNPFPLATQVKLENAATSYIRTNLKLASNSNVHIIVKAGNRFYRNSVPIKVTVGGCGGGGGAGVVPDQTDRDLTDNTRMRGQIRDGQAVVRVVIRHPMETGQRKNAKTGKPIPAHYIKRVVAKHNNRVVYEGDWSASISQNPGFGFKLAKGRKGDQISVHWSDNKGLEGGTVSEIR